MTLQLILPAQVCNIHLKVQSKSGWSAVDLALISRHCTGHWCFLAHLGLLLTLPQICVPNRYGYTVASTNAPAVKLSFCGDGSWMYNKTGYQTSIQWCGHSFPWHPKHRSPNPIMAKMSTIQKNALNTANRRLRPEMQFKTILLKVI